VLSGYNLSHSGGRKEGRKEGRRKERKGRLERMTPWKGKIRDCGDKEESGQCEVAIKPASVFEVLSSRQENKEKESEI
jgi:hypothetical protein